MAVANYYRRIMKKYAIVVVTALLVAILVGAQTNGARKKEDGPQPPVVDPGGPEKAPSDAIVLFNGKDLSNWMMADGKPAEWTLQDGALVCRTGSGDLYSRLRFRSAQIHLEFNVPSMPGRSGQARGNSGVMLHDRTNEIQILDSFQNPTYADGVCGALYGVAPPQVNACRPPGEWQTYDIVFHAPHCGTGGQVQPGSLTVLCNRVLIQDHVPDSPRSGCVEEGPLILQDHNGFGGKRVAATAEMRAPITPMRFRNIWIRRLAN
jgi:hypothetical protein